MTLKFDKPGKKPKLGKTQDESDHLNWVASQPCSIKGCSNPVNVHHIRLNGEPKDHRKTIPLCHFHHQGEMGLHTLGKHAWRKIFGHELDMLDELMKRK